MDFYFRGVWRMDWGFGNPNITAAVIAMLMVAVWGLVWIRRSWFIVAWVLFTGLGICLVHTFSRGGILALIAGLVAPLCYAPRPWPRGRVIAVIASGLILTGTSFYLGAGARYTQGIASEDRSISNRLKIWQHVPRMMVDAPEGWGKGQAAWAFMQWYQDVDARETYLNLVSSHFTWLVEFPWRWRIAYVLGWTSALALCWPNERLRWGSVPLGIGMAFLIAASFTHVAAYWWVWFVPGAALCLTLVMRFSAKNWPGWRSWTLVGGATAAFFVGVLVGSVKDPGIPIQGAPFGSIVGKGNPGTWVVIDPKVLGEQPGKTLRRYLQGVPQTSESIGIARSLAEIPVDRRRMSQRLVVAGALKQNELTELRGLFAGNRQVICLNPGFFPVEVGLFGKASHNLLTAFFGEFSQSPSRASWDALSMVRPIEGSGDFLANWPEIVLSNTL